MINRKWNHLAVMILLFFSISLTVQSIQFETDEIESTDLNPIAKITPQQTNASWTVMTWINADSEGEHDAMDALQELELGFVPNNDINVVSFIDRNRGLDTSNGDWTGGKYFEVQSDDDTRIISSIEVMDLGEVNQGNPATLRNFVTWAQTNYPAENYALTYIGHGIGIGGMSYDADNNYDALSVDEVRVAMDGLHVDIFVLDGCAMGTIEVAYEWRSFTDLLLISEEIVQKDGMDYEYAISELQKDPNISPKDFGRIWIDSAVLPIQYPLTLTRTLLNTSTLPNLVESVSNFSSSLLDLNSSEIAIVSTLRRNITLIETFMTDLYYFADLVYGSTLENQTLKSAAFKLMLAFNDTIIHAYQGPNDPQVRGLSIYFPTDSQAQTWFPTYITASPDYEFNKMDFLTDTLWNEFLTYYLNEAPILVSPPIAHILIELEQNYEIINPVKNEIKYYSLIITRRGIYNFSLDVLQGDVQLWISAMPSTSTVLAGQVFSYAQNPDQKSYEQVVHWLETGIYQMEIFCLQDACSSNLTVSKQDAKPLDLDEVVSEDFPPRRGGAGPAIQTIHHYYEVELEACIYDISVVASDHALLGVTLWTNTHGITLSNFRGNEGQDYHNLLNRSETSTVMIEIFPHAWSGSFSLSISKGVCESVTTTTLPTTATTTTSPTMTTSPSTTIPSTNQSSEDSSSVSIFGFSFGAFIIIVNIRKRITIPSIGP